ncbi:MAG TPA: methyltransferase domain-containing protein [Methylomirabilota bacterium]|nr:methyltransferase domain-containing protein [Methylomirabilota bacterium]
MKAEEAESVYDEVADAYRDWWGPIIAPGAVGVLDEIGVRPGADAPFELLDLGSGTGILALTALQRWPAVRVIAVDPSSRMLAIAANAARERSSEALSRLQTVTASAGHMPLGDATIDAAVSSFMIQLVPSRAAALREVLRVLRPGGRFGCVTWRADDPPYEPDDAFADALDELQIIQPDHQRDVRPYASARAAGAEFRRAGFRDVRASDVWLEHRFTAETYLDLLEHWIDRELFAGLDGDTREQLRALALKLMADVPERAFLWRRPLVQIAARRRA